MKGEYYYVYILVSSSRRAMYIGITSNIHKRVFEHKHGLLDRFTKDYNVHRLVYFERHSAVQRAIAREKQLIGWRRAKKNALVEKNQSKLERLERGLV
jgi:putative endonuclease